MSRVPGAPERELHARRRRAPVYVPQRHFDGPRYHAVTSLTTLAAKTTRRPQFPPPLSSPLCKARRHAPAIAAVGTLCNTRREREVSSAVNSSHHHCRQLLVPRHLPS
jgi:hypothetical protein